jgi:hypothetical protein
MSFSPSSATAGETVTVTVTLTYPAQDGGAIVELNSDNAALDLPDAINVPQGETTVSFDTVLAADLDPVEVATITGSASVAETTVTAALTTTSLHAWQPSTVALTFDANVLNVLDTAAGTITLASAPASDLTFTLSSDAPLASLPASVTVLAGHTTKTFAVTA